MRLYITPKVGTGKRPNDLWRAKYFTAGPEQLVTSLTTAHPLGAEPWMLVGSEVTPAEHTAVAAQSDVIVIPATLDDTPSFTQVSNIQSRLAVCGFPSAWVTTGHTYREIVACLIKVCMFQQRAFTKARLMVEGVTLDTPVMQLPLSRRLALVDAATRMGLDPDNANPSMTVQQVLVRLARQLPPVRILGEVF